MLCWRCHELNFGATICVQPCNMSGTVIGSIKLNEKDSARSARGDGANVEGAKPGSIEKNISVAYHR